MTQEARATRILAVDDDLIARRLLEAILEKQGHEVVLAESVRDAQQKIGELGMGSFDAVVTDYRMPELTGLDLVAWLKGRDASLAIIMITAESERRLLAESLRSGVQDFLDKPLSIPQLLSAVARAVETTRRQRHLQDAEKAVREIAAVQQTLLKMHAGAVGERLEVYFHPRQDAGGDFLGVFPVRPGRFVVLATDVSGHDLKAAFIASHFQGIVRGMLERNAAIEEVFGSFNEFLVNQWNLPGNWGQHSFTETSVAACALDVDLNARTIAVLNCGFPLPLFIGADGRPESMLHEGTSPLGWFPNPPLKPAIRSTATSSAVYLWSDGLDDLAAVLRVDPMSIVSRLHLDRLNNESSRAIFDQAKDDILAVRLDIGASKDTTSQPSIIVCQTYTGQQLTQIDELQDTWERSLRFAVPGIQDTPAYDIVLCLREAVINALLHGCKASGSLSATVHVDWFPALQRVRVDVQDPGNGHTFDLASHEARAETELVTEHRGLILIKSLSTSFRTERNGAGIRMEFNLS
jgi:CheY-like chemotaxis protein/anti-sigma regulatory factor (Ser/Thr protein kinase)